jgi:hypothetical protein
LGHDWLAYQQGGYPDTMIIYALQELNIPVLRAGYANRQTFTKADRQYYALLGSKNGAGCGFFLLQHKAALGVMDIVSIDVWHAQGEDDDGDGDEDDSSGDECGGTAVGFPVTGVDPYNPVEVEEFFPVMLFTLQTVTNPMVYLLRKCVNCGDEPGLIFCSLHTEPFPVASSSPILVPLLNNVLRLQNLISAENTSPRKVIEVAWFGRLSVIRSSHRLHKAQRSHSFLRPQRQTKSSERFERYVP